MKCNVCKSQEHELLVNVKSRKIYTCNNCGLVFIKPLPSKSKNQKTVDKISNSFYDEYKLEEESYRKYFLKKIKDIKKYKKKGSILDVGCGPGTFLVEAKKSGYETYGVDLSTEAVKISKGRKLNAKKDSLKEVRFRKKQFDIITTFQLIEHVLNPRLLIEQAYKKLNKGGILVIATPNQRGLLSRLSGKKWFEYYNLEHNYYFSEQTLTTLTEDNGFEILQCKTEFGRELNLVYVWDRLVNYYYTKDTSINKIINLLKFIPNIIGDKIAIREPFVNVYLIAIKK